VVRSLPFVEDLAMANDSQTTPIFHASPPGRRTWPWLGIGVFTLAVLAIYCVLRGTTQDGHAQDLGELKDRPAPPMFVGWTKPDLAIVVSGQMYGYLQPCGCSRPQKGGLTRRYNFMQTLKTKGWPVTAVDLGDLAQASGPQQRLKYVVSMNALRLMGYQAIGIGKNELLMPLIDALANYSIDNPEPKPLAVNLAKTEKGELFYDLNVRQGEVFQTGRLKVGVVGAIGSVTAQKVEAALPPKQTDIKFLNNVEILPRALAGLGERNVDACILLYQGEEKEGKPQADGSFPGAVACAEFLHKQRLQNQALAAVQVLICLTNEEEPPSIPKIDAKAPNTSIITLGHKGRYVGVVGLWKKGNDIEVKYQLVSMGPEYATKSGQEKNNPVMALIEKYAEDVRKGNYLARFPRGKHEVQATYEGAKYVGSDRCGDCHPQAFQVWKASRHAHAFDTLVRTENPKLRQFDGECVVCHTVGFKYHTGYYDPPRGSTTKQIDKHNAKLVNVGCESCHGPGSEHANNFNDKKLYAAINPHRPSAKELDAQTTAGEKKELRRRRMLRLDDFCQQCHDPDNDVNWGSVPFEQKWDQIVHPLPKKGVNAAQAKSKE
jgi:hypothetical protein